MIEQPGADSCMRLRMLLRFGGTACGSFCRVVRLYGLRGYTRSLLLPLGHGVQRSPLKGYSTGMPLDLAAGCFGNAAGFKKSQHINLHLVLLGNSLPTGWNNSVVFLWLNL